jgi:hypothetical protein
MSNDKIKELLQDPVIVKIVKIIDKASLSILELLEFGITRQEINHALAAEIIRFDKESTTDENGITAGGDYYFKFLSSKVKLTEEGFLLLQHMHEVN